MTVVSVLSLVVGVAALGWNVLLAKLNGEARRRDFDRWTSKRVDTSGWVDEDGNA